ncbi:MAG: hypothetical protein ABII88_05335 [Candidatus Omnitrophota bacterium]
MGRTLALIIAALFLLSNSVFAIPAEGEFLPIAHKSIWGVQFNNIFARDFNKVEGKAGTTQYFVKASYGLSERLFIDGKIGLGKVVFKRNDGLKLNFPTGFAGGYGFRYLCYDDAQKKIKVIAGFQHISCHPFKDIISNINHRVIWDEWQGTLLLKKDFGKTAVYAGPQLSLAQLKYKVDDFRRRLKSEDSLGALLGIDYQIAENASVNLESRMFDEWAVNMGMSYRF